MIALCTLPFAVAGIVMNVLYPGFFTMHLGLPGMIAGIVLLALGIPVWFSSAFMIIIYVPRHRLITTGPFALVAHPLYTSIALLVIPGTGLLFDTWVGFAIGAVLYVSSRIFSVREDRNLEEAFGEEYRRYRERVMVRWL